MRLYEVWHPRTDIKKNYDNPYGTNHVDGNYSSSAASGSFSDFTTNTSSTSSSSSSIVKSNLPLRRKGVRFACYGCCILPPRMEGWPPLFTTVALSVGSIVYILMASFVTTAISTVFTIIGGFCFLCTWYFLISFLVTDPGFLPKHITALPQLVPERLQCPPDAIGPAPPVTLIRISTTIPSKIIDTPIECKFCVTCRIWRPPNTHHCSTCGGCISDFDHHCGVLGKCVGSGNSHTFFYLLWSGTVSCLYGFLYSLLVIIFNSINFTYPTTDTNNNPLPNVWIYDNTQYSLWITGGVCLGILVFGNGICRCLRACMQSFCGLAFVSLLGIIGYVCIIIAYIRGAYENNHRLDDYNVYHQISSSSNDPSNPYSNAIIPAVIGIVPYLYISVIIGGMAIGTTTMWSIERTTKQNIHTALPDNNTVSDPRKSNVSNDGTRTDWSCRSRIRNLTKLLCFRTNTYHAVNFRSDISELRKLVKQSEIDIFNQAEQRVLAQQQQPQPVFEKSDRSTTGEHLTIGMSHNEIIHTVTIPSVLAPSIRPSCHQALELSLSPGMVEDAITITKVTTEGFEKQSQQMNGIVLGFDFLPLGNMMHTDTGS